MCRTTPLLSRQDGRDSLMGFTASLHRRGIHHVGDDPRPFMLLHVELASFLCECLVYAGTEGMEELRSYKHALLTRLGVSVKLTCVMIRLVGFSKRRAPKVECLPVGREG